jgi:hypothetical protein
MPATLSGLRPLVPDDLAWVLHLCELRRKRIAGYAVRLWRPAPGARDHHRVFLSHQIQDPRVLSLRTDHGFVFAAPRADLLDVDDMGLDDDDRWPDDGIRLLQAVLQRSDARFVCPVPEPARTQTAVAAGMQLAESWWHRDLPTTDPPTTATAPVDDPILDVPGASGRLVQAPPVYAPGGSVLLVLQVDSENALTAIEDAAIAAGAVVSVVPLLPTNTTTCSPTPGTSAPRTSSSRADGRGASLLRSRMIIDQAWAQAGSARSRGRLARRAAVGVVSTSVNSTSDWVCSRQRRTSSSRRCSPCGRPGTGPRGIA